MSNSLRNVAYYISGLSITLVLQGIGGLQQAAGLLSSASLQASGSIQGSIQAMLQTANSLEQTGSLVNVLNISSPVVALYDGAGVFQGSLSLLQMAEMMLLESGAIAADVGELTVDFQLSGFGSLSADLALIIDFLLSGTSEINLSVFVSIASFILYMALQDTLPLNISLESDTIDTGVSYNTQLFYTPLENELVLYLSLSP